MVARPDAAPRGTVAGTARKHCMKFHQIAGAACRALTASKDGPSLYDICDPALLKYDDGDLHLGQFYRTALSNPALRPLLRRAGRLDPAILVGQGHRDRTGPMRRLRGERDWQTSGRGLVPPERLWVVRHVRQRRRVGGRLLEPLVSGRAQRWLGLDERRLQKPNRARRRLLLRTSRDPPGGPRQVADERPMAIS